MLRFCQSRVCTTGTYLFRFQHLLKEEKDSFTQLCDHSRYETPDDLKPIEDEKRRLCSIESALERVSLINSRMSAVLGPQPSQWSLSSLASGARRLFFEPTHTAPLAQPEDDEEEEGQINVTEIFLSEFAMILNNYSDFMRANRATITVDMMQDTYSNWLNEVSRLLSSPQYSEAIGPRLCCDKEINELMDNWPFD